jgi:hypothetical protein
LSVAADEPFIRQKMLRSERSAEMEFLRGNSNFRAQTEFAAVGKSRRSVVINRRAVNFVQKLLGVFRVCRDNRRRMSAGIFVDFFDCF